MAKETFCGWYGEPGLNLGSMPRFSFTQDSSESEIDLYVVKYKVVSIREEVGRNYYIGRLIKKEKFIGKR